MNSQLNLLLGLVKMEILLFIWLVLAASFEIRPEDNRPPATLGSHVLRREAWSAAISVSTRSLVVFPTKGTS